MDNNETTSQVNISNSISNDCDADFEKDPDKGHFKNVFIVLLCLLSSILTTYLINNPYGSYIPIILIAIFEWYRSYPLEKRSYYGLCRLLLFILFISLWVVFILKVVIESIGLLLGYKSIPLKKVEHLFPYAFIFTSFGRTKSSMNLNDKRRYIIHLLYDIPAFFLVIIFKLLNNPLNSLYSPITRYCYLGCLPTYIDVKQLNQIGIEYVINMCAEYKGPIKTYEKYHIKQLYLPTIDSTAPSVKTIEKAIKFMNQALKEKKKIFVHCKAGMGRSATIVYCHLIVNENILPEDAIKLLKEKRPEITTSLVHYPSVKYFLASFKK
jgi:atypical dual specificity phosphatase